MGGKDRQRSHLWLPNPASQKLSLSAYPSLRGPRGGRSQTQAREASAGPEQALHRQGPHEVAEVLTAWLHRLGARWD